MGRIVLVAWRLMALACLLWRCGDDRRCTDPCLCQAKLPVKALAPVPADILLVLDASESMLQPLSKTDRTSRWQALREGVLATLPVVEQAGHQVALFAFPDPGKPASGCAVADAPLMPLGTDIASMRQQLLAIEPQRGSQTPMLAAMQATQAYMKTLSGDRRRVVVLGTDGLPKCDAKTPYDDAATLRVAELLRRQQRQTGVPTAVFGISTAASTDEAVLQQLLNMMADAGGFSLGGSGQRFYDVDAPQSLAQALRGVTQSGGDCRFQLPEAPPNMRLLQLQLDDLPIEQQEGDGWRYLDEAAQQVQLHGGACEQVRRGGVGELKAFYQPTSCQPPSGGSIPLL